MTAEQAPLVLALGLLTGLHASCWGAYKDHRFEGFRPRSFVRSTLLGGASAAAFLVAGVADQRLVVLAGLLYTTERLLTEWWKTILRVDDQSSYDIPMRLAVRGTPIDDDRRRILVGLGLVAGFTLACLAVSAIDAAVTAPLPWPALVLLGGVGGWLTAFGGAWKDAPIEGFETAKFFRSPAVATAWAVLLSGYTDSWVALVLAAGGMSVATIETYKTFLSGDKAPGKFMLRTPAAARPRMRSTLALAVTGLWSLFAVAAVVDRPDAALGTGLPVGSAAAATLVVLVAGLLGAAASLGHLWTARARPAPSGAPTGSPAEDERIVG